MDLDAAIDIPVMKFFWPLRQTAELSETIEDPYDDKNETAPKRRRKDSDTSSSDDSEKCKRFGHDLSTDESSSSSSEDEEDKPKIQEITTIDPNDEENEFEVRCKQFRFFRYRDSYAY